MQSRRERERKKKEKGWEGGRERDREREGERREKGWEGREREGIETANVCNMLK